MKKQVTKWFDIKDIQRIRNLPGFIHAYQYSRHVKVNANEWGLVELDDEIIRYRGTSTGLEIHSQHNQ